MTNPGRKRRKRKTVLGVFFRLFFVLQPEPELLPKYFVHIREWLGLRQIDLLQQY